MSFNAARQKRTAESSARFGDSKKPRFDLRNPSTLAPEAPEEDTILDLDEIGRSGQHTKRNAVNLDGFESDSSTEDLHARTARDRRAAEGTSKGKDAAEEGDVDMFADDDDVGDPGGDDDYSSKRKEKEVRFLDVSEIEGQDSKSKSGGHVSSELLKGSNGKGKAPAEGSDVESSSESGDDEDRAALDPEDEDAEEVGAGSKKRHAPRLDAFNMRSEAEEGRFDASGNYVRNAADPDAVHDRWLEGISKKQIRQAAEAKRKQDEETRLRNAADDALLTSDLLASLIRELNRGETALEALARLNKERAKAERNKPKKLPAWQAKKLAEQRGVSVADLNLEDPKEAEAAARRTASIEAISDAAARLTGRGRDDIYDHPRETLTRLYRTETGEEWQDPKVEWEFRYVSSDGTKSEIHGPYDAETMREWVIEGQFQAEVEFKIVGGGEADWTDEQEF